MLASNVDPHRLDDVEPWARTRLSELMHAFQLTFDKPMERQPIDVPSNVEFLNMADTSVRRLVKMAKMLALFRSLHQEDQISMLKGAVVEVLVLRSSKMFSAETQGWQVGETCLVPRCRNGR